MNREQELNDILDKCLERVLFQGETIEQCLAGYPAQADELRPLLTTALSAQKAISITPRLEFREKARHQFQATLREMEAKKTRHVFSWQPRWATVAISLLVFVLAGGSTVAAAGNSMPDQALYPVKLATEQVRLTLTPTAMGKAELSMRLADERVAEIEYLASKGDEVQMERVGKQLKEHLRTVETAAASQKDQGAPGVMSAPATPPSLAAPVPAPQPAPEATPPVAAPEAPGMKLGEPTKSPQTAEAPKTLDRGAGQADKATGKSDKQARLRELLEDKAAKNPEALKQALKKAPESVKPALRKIIEESDIAYQKALEAAD